MGLYEPQNTIFGLFFDISGPTGGKSVKNRENESVEQGVPVYDPQVVAMHTLPLAAHLSSTARGSRLNPDVRP